MRRRSLAVLGILAVVMVACVACGGTSATPADTATVSMSASATPSLTRVQRDDRFITASGLVDSGSRDGLISLGERACGAFAEGSKADAIRAIFVGKGLTPTEANRVLLAAVAVYCPEFGNSVNP